MKIALFQIGDLLMGFPRIFTTIQSNRDRHSYPYIGLKTIGASFASAVRYREMKTSAGTFYVQPGVHEEVDKKGKLVWIDENTILDEVKFSDKEFPYKIFQISDSRRPLNKLGDKTDQADRHRVAVYKAVTGGELVNVSLMSSSIALDGNEGLIIIKHDGCIAAPIETNHFKLVKLLLALGYDIEP